MAYVPDLDYVDDAPPGFDTARMTKMQLGIADAHTIGESAAQVANEALAKAEGGGSAVSANAYGASPGASWQGNRDAFQAAIDAAATFGAGRVVADPGEYLVKGILQESHVELYLPGVTLRSPDGQKPGVIAARYRTTTASASGSVLTVADATHFEVGGLVAVEHAGGILDSQWSYLTSPATAAGTELAVVDAAPSWRSWGVLQVEDELIGHSGFDSTTGALSGIERGALGTSAASHPTSARIGVARHHYATVTAIDGTSITIDRPVALPVSGTTVHIGIVSPSLTHVTVDGNAPAGGAAGSVSSVSWGLVAGGSVLDLSISNSDHGGLMLFQGTRAVSAQSVRLHNCGIPDIGKGSALWLYQGASQNHITDLRISGDTWVAIYADDRTTSGDPWDAPADENTVSHLTIDTTVNAPGGPAAITVVACNRNRFTDFIIRGASRGFSIAETHQGVVGDGSLPTATGNEFGSGLVDVYSQPWGALSGGNFLHDLWFTDFAAENPVVVPGNFVHSIRQQMGAGMVGPAFPNGSPSSPAIALSNDPDTGFYAYAEDTWAYSAGGARRMTIYPNQLRFEDGVNLEFGTGAGSRIGFTGTRKIAFWGGTPTTQPANIPDTGSADVAALEVEVNKLKALLRTIGLMGA